MRGTHNPSLEPIAARGAAPVEHLEYHMAMFRIALLQLTSEGIDPSRNLQKAADWCAEATKQEADLVLLPEMWSIGYKLEEMDFANGGWKQFACAAIGDHIRQYAKLAIQLGTAIAATYLENFRGRPRNAVAVADRFGRVVLNYSKVHTCAFDIEKWLLPGKRFSVCDLDTKNGTVRLGAMICYDREFPESARLLMLKGAEIIVTPNACQLETNRISQIRARAFENMVGIAVANYAGPPCEGHSTAFHPIAFSRDGISQEMKIVEANEQEQATIADFDMDEIRSYRARETWGNAYRRPETYKDLTSKRVDPPFKRKKDGA
jgi:predicted amidohydrolase